MELTDSTMMLSNNLFKTTLFLLAFLGSCQVTYSQTIRFDVIDDLRYGSSRLGDPWYARSLVTCLFECMAKYLTCFSAVYNEYSGICTPGGPLTFGIGKPSSLYGDTFYYTDYCNTSMGYKLFVYSSIVDCLYISPKGARYLDARNDCTARGGRVMQAKTQDRYDLFVRIARDVIKGNTFLGLTDIATEGKFVWEDGEVLKNTWKTHIFLAGEPNDPGGGDDCATVGNYGKFTGLYDGYCLFNSFPDYRYYICERIH